MALKSKAGLFGVAVIALAWTQVASAQEINSGTVNPQGPSNGAEGSVSSSAPQDIIVTAQRRSQSLQDVPVTVTVFGAEQIQSARIQRVEDVVTRTVGLNFDAFPASQPRLVVRGIGSSDRGAAGDPSSAVFLDDIYLGRPAAIAFDAFDIERIEVLKGPQGTLFGRNVVGGAINVITRKPDVSAVDASFETTYGNYDRFDAAGFVNMPFANNSGAIRASASYRSHDGYVRNAFLNRDVDDQETLSGRFQFLAEPIEDLRVLFTVDGTRDRATGPANHVLERDTSDPRSGLYSVYQDPDFTYGSDVGYQNRDTVGVRGEVSYDTSLATVTLLGSYRDLSYGLRYDFDGGNAVSTSPGFNRLNIGGGNDEQAELSSQEIRISSLPTSPVEWVAGFYHYNQQVDRSDIFILDSRAVAPIALTEIYNQDSSLDSIAFFGDVTVPLTDQFSVIGGARYTKDDKTYRVRNTGSRVPLRGSELFDVTTSASFDAVTWRAGLNFKPNADHLFYGMVSRGFKSGGFQETPTSALDAAAAYNPETATQYEIGQKSSFFNGRLIWNNTLFYLDYKDLQTRQADPTTGGIFTTNAGAATIKGFETQLQARLFTGFNLSAAYAYTDGTFDVYVEDGVDFAGNRISRTPRHKVSLSPSYTYELGGRTNLTIAADYRYESKIFDDNSNQPPEIRPATHFIDARVILNGIADHFSMSLWGKNLTDERTRTFQSVFLGANFGAYNEPRTYGATLRWEY
ncbi:TonB-dependent receptor [Sphingobium sp. SCG-1]|uniref:TonB-dependent receptor n=1 Tax=Sphingobium sp. SCG-1 TaxID=2072936 RepID=UPI000CD6A832|nr:TonB-dependent receptor [Sphingobium sp. SCG-1]AUW60021.1 TonB-dependent receptor [Sphingobium sp. SCG-1]